MTGVPLLLVDGHNWLFRACFGTPAQIWSRDQHDKRELTTEFMFFAMLRKGINEELPGWPEVVVVFDGENGSAQRKATDSDYKANRPNDDEALKPIRALPAVKAGLDLFAITWVEITDAEADDVIATLAASCPERDVLIASVDQDYYQLLRDAGPGRGSVRVLNTARRAGSRLAGPAEVRARHGVTPAQFADYRALAGDTSDNIPGVRGIGAKTAAALLDGGLTLDDLPASGRLAGRKGTAITSAWQQVLTWRDMIRMNSQVPVPGEAVTGLATTPLPRPAEVIEKLGLWKRPPSRTERDPVVSAPRAGGNQEALRSSCRPCRGRRPGSRRRRGYRVGGVLSRPHPRLVREPTARGGPPADRPGDDLCPGSVRQDARRVGARHHDGPELPPGRMGQRGRCPHRRPAAEVLVLHRPGAARIWAVRSAGSPHLGGNR
jgi:DNA polymerase-1